MTTEKICFRYDGSEEAKECIEWINSLNKSFNYKGEEGLYYTNESLSMVRHSTDDTTELSPYRLVTPAEFLRLVKGEEWKVGDECEYDGTVAARKGKIVGFYDHYVWVKIPETEMPISVPIKIIRPIRKSVRQEIEHILSCRTVRETQIDEIMSLIKQRKDEL